MNIYKIYFNHTIELLDKFKLDSNYNFDNTEILKKITLEPPKNTINGDMSTNLAMLLSKSLKLNPKEIANKLKPYISKLPNVHLLRLLDQVLLILRCKKILGQIVLRTYF